MERTPPGDDKKPGEEPKDKELPLPQVAEGQVPAEQGGYRGYGTSPTQSESDLFAEYLNAVGAPSAPPAADVIEGWKLGLGSAEPALLHDASDLADRTRSCGAVVDGVDKRQ